RFLRRRTVAKARHDSAAGFWYRARLPTKALTAQAARDSPLKKPIFYIPATASPGPGAPPQGLWAFYWHFIRQSKGWYLAMFATSLSVALLDTVIPLFIGKLVAVMAA